MFCLLGSVGFCRCRSAGRGRPLGLVAFVGGKAGCSLAFVPVTLPRLPANRARASEAHRGTAAAGGRLPRPGSHLVSGAGAARAPRAARAGERARSRTRTELTAGAGGDGGRLSVPPPSGTWQPPAGSGGGRLGGGGGGGERRRGPAGPGPAQPSALPRPDTAPGAEMADEPQKKSHLSALVGHTNGLTKPASLTATRSTGGGGGGATASSKKLVIKNFRGGYGAGRALCPGRCARPELCLLRPRPGPAALSARGGCGRADSAAGLITPPAPCPCKGSRGHAWGSVRRGGSGRRERAESHLSVSAD